MRDTQARVAKAFEEAFGRTSLQQRLDDILGEAQELHRYTDFPNLREETGDLLASALALVAEMGWDANLVVGECLEKIQGRMAQYRSLGRKFSVAVLGGAFDPVTNGHVAMAKYVLDSCGVFDEVWIMPCHRHMFNKEMAAPEHRLEMCRIATEGMGSIRVSPYEIDQRLSGETYQLVRRLLDERFAKSQYDFSFILGMDNANIFHKWVNYRYLERLARFVVVARPGVDPEEDVDWYRREPHILVPPSDRLLQTSSTLVRSLLRSGQAAMAAQHMHPMVMEYIREHRLYRGNEGKSP